MTGQLGLEGVEVTPEGGDFIATPPAVTRALLRFCPPPRDETIVDPCAGGGAILQVLVEEGWPLASLAACEIRPEEREHLEAVAGRVVIGDWQDVCRDLNRAQALIANPPFSQLPSCSRSRSWRASRSRLGSSLASARRRT